MTLVCKTHQVVLIVEGNKRVIQPPRGSYGIGCQLVSNPHPELGKTGDCEIIEEK